MPETLREFKRLHTLALSQGWSVPNPDTDNHGPAAWVGYWRALEHNLVLRRQGQRVTARPIQPHTPGSRGLEDHLQRAERINRNHALWRGYLT
jgi:hypothetical protein